MGDGRTYNEVLALRAVNSQDAMTADWVRIPPEVLDVTAPLLPSGSDKRGVYQGDGDNTHHFQSLTFR